MHKKENEIYFNSLGLSAPILKAVTEEGYEIPSPIQAEAIPPVIEGKDVMAAAQTGTGKTAAFTLPILELLSNGRLAQANHTRVLILTPTRELAAQIGESVTTYGRHLSLTSAVVFGGVKINPQMIKLRRGVDILVATPGRLFDLYNQRAIKFNQLEILVLDEADRMLDMGFIRDIRKIIKILPRQRQNLMFSATFSHEIRNLAKGLINNPVEISVTPRNTTVDTVKHWIYPVDKNKKSALLTHLIRENKWKQALVFNRTKHGANRITRHLEKSGISAVAIHGNKSQAARTKALANFKDGTIRIMVATDIAARGLDINQLPQVVNFDLPNVPENYIHRIGRTGRAGLEGHAISLVCADELKELSDIERLIKQLLERKSVDGFEPVHKLQETSLDKRPIFPKKPKNPISEHRNGQRSRTRSRSNKPKTQDRQSSGNYSHGNKTEQQENRNSRSTYRGNKTNRQDSLRDGGKPQGQKPQGYKPPKKSRDNKQRKV